MAADFSSEAKIGGGATVEVSLNSTGTNVVEVTLPKWCRSANARGEDNAGAAASFRFARSGTDGAAQVSDAFTVDSGAVYPIVIAPGRSRQIRAADRKICVSGSNSGKVRLALREED